ncbi:MAG: TraB/GumN family protein [Treponema sp.]|nr:TraB/GumN family protein [Treponema sp.]
MKHIFTFSVLVLTLALIFTCISTPVLPAREQGGSSVWRISRNGNTLYLGGSIHILREDDFPLPAEFDLAFSQSAALIIEADIEQMGKEESAAYLISNMLLDRNQSLQTLLDTDVYAMLAAKVNEYGIPIESVSGFRPSMVITMLTMFQIQELGFTQQGIDPYYFQKARNENKPVHFLESVESQINMLVSMGEGYENEFVQYSLQDMNNTEMFLTTIANDWRSGESASTEMSLKKMKEEWPQMYKSLITDRHDAWMPLLEEYLDSGTTFFVVVGLAHMHGPDGLLRLLEDLGCTVERF